MLISVVMTSYNHEKYLAQAIESVLSQTVADLELIMVDDASKDNSREIISEYQKKDARVRSILHTRNEGISITTNDGFAGARGDCIAYIQSDDLWRKDKLEVQLKALSENKGTIIWSDAEIIDSDGKPTGQLFTQRYRSVNKPKTGNLFQSLARDNYICGQSLFFDCSVIKSLHFDTGLVFANDYKFMLEVSQKYEFYFIPEPLVKYRIHSTNSIHKNRDIWQKDIFLITRYLLGECGNNLPSDIKARLYSRVGQYLHERKHFTYACRSFQNAIRLWPGKTSYYRSCLKSYMKSLI